MKRWLAHCLLFAARLSIRAANHLNPPTVTWVDGSGKRWTYPSPRKGVITFRSAIYTGGPTGPAMQRYLDELEARGWN